MAVRGVPGDKNISDLTPPSLNKGGRLVKNMRLAGSGIYKYHRSEASLFGLDPSFIPVHQQYFNMYRPPEVLERRKDYFARVPIITGRHVVVDTGNAKQLTVGLVGDTVETEYDPKDGELYLYATGTIIAGDGVQAYNELKQLSVGYTPRCEWRKGVHRGEHYDAVLLDFEDVNHLLICQEARGGPQCVIMDSLSGEPPVKRGSFRMSILSRLAGLINGGKASEPTAAVHLLLDSIALGADPKAQVATAQTLLAGDSRLTPPSRAVMTACMETLAGVDKADTAEVGQAVALVKQTYDQLVAGDRAPKQEPLSPVLPANATPPAPVIPPQQVQPPVPPVPQAGDMNVLLMQQMTQIQQSLQQQSLAIAQMLSAQSAPRQAPGDQLQPFNQPVSGWGGQQATNGAPDKSLLQAFWSSVYGKEVVAK